MFKLKLQHWFAIWLMAMAALVFLTQPDERPDKLEAVAFDTTSSSELYFKNVRSYYYRQSEEAEGMLIAYRLKSLFDDAEQLVLPFVIYHNWRTHEAFIRLDTNYSTKARLPHFLAIEGISGVDSLIFPELDHESQYEFARGVYRALNSDLPIKAHGQSGQERTISGNERVSTKRILTDYFKLLDKL